MSWILSFISDQWVAILPFILAIAGFLFGGVQKNKAEKEKAKRHTAEIVSASNSVRAAVAEEITDFLVKETGRSKEQITDEVSRNRTHRNHFSD